MELWRVWWESLWREGTQGDYRDELLQEPRESWGQHHNRATPAKEILVSHAGISDK